MADQKTPQGGFPQNKSVKPDNQSTTGDGHPPRTANQDMKNQTTGQSKGQTAGSGQKTSGSNK